MEYHSCPFAISRHFHLITYPFVFQNSIASVLLFAFQFLVHYKHITSICRVPLPLSCIVQVLDRTYGLVCPARGWGRLLTLFFIMDVVVTMFAFCLCSPVRFPRVGVVVCGSIGGSHFNGWYLLPWVASASPISWSLVSGVRSCVNPASC